jgi:hypothetical protein
MNCPESCDQIQRLLDGETAPLDLEAHLATCKNCHELHAVARTMLRGLSQSAVLVPPDGFADSVVLAVLRDRARWRTRRRLMYATAMAAALLVAVGVFRLNRDGAEKNGQVAIQPEMTQPSLQENVQQAGQALADLTRRTAVDTLETSRTLLPAVDFNGAAEPTASLADISTEPRRALSDAVGGVSVGLEPLAASAWQAAAFFRREMPFRDSEAGNAIK